MLYTEIMNSKDEQLNGVGLQQIKPAATVNFSSAADDFVTGTLDLNNHLVKHPAATFFFRAAGNSMCDIGISNGDLLIIDRSLMPRNNSIVIATLDGEFVVRQMKIRDGKMYLCLPGDSHQEIILTNNEEMQIWGVVTHAVHDVRPA